MQRWWLTHNYTLETLTNPLGGIQPAVVLLLSIILWAVDSRAAERLQDYSLLYSMTDTANSVNITFIFERLFSKGF